MNDYEICLKWIIDLTADQFILGGKDVFCASWCADCVGMPVKRARKAFKQILADGYITHASKIVTYEDDYGISKHYPLNGYTATDKLKQSEAYKAKYRETVDYMNDIIKEIERIKCEAFSQMLFTNG